jgi:rRNA processing protein Krr1/Pno1
VIIMAKQIVAIVGTYRKGRVIDTAVSEILRGAQSRGARTRTIYLLDEKARQRAFRAGEQLADALNQPA